MKLSLVIPAKDANDPKLKVLLTSIETQDFPKDEMETLIITEGTSESAKAIGIRRAKGEIIGILASDNELIDKKTLFALTHACKATGLSGAQYPYKYFYDRKDNILNRYFSLIGGNDPLCYYMGKNDRLRQDQKLEEAKRILGKSYGDNGFFVKKSLIEKTDLDNYYHIDNANEMEEVPWAWPGHEIKHNTGGNIFKFFAKRYRYGLQHAFNLNRRWHLVDFSQPKDIVRLIWFIIATLTIIPTLSLSIRGYLKVPDVAWFLHPLICLATLFTYGILMVHLFIKRLFQSSFAPMAVQKA